MKLTFAPLALASFAVAAPAAGSPDGSLFASMATLQPAMASLQPAMASLQPAMASLQPAIATLTPAKREEHDCEAADMHLVMDFVNHEYMDHVPDHMNNFDAVLSIVDDARAAIDILIKEAGPLEANGTISHQKVEQFKLNQYSVFKRLDEMDLEKRDGWWDDFVNVAAGIAQACVDKVVDAVSDSVCTGHGSN